MRRIDCGRFVGIGAAWLCIVRHLQGREPREKVDKISWLWLTSRPRCAATAGMPRADEFPKPRDAVDGAVALHEESVDSQRVENGRILSSEDRQGCRCDRTAEGPGIEVTEEELDQFNSGRRRIGAFRDERRDSKTVG